MSVDSIRTIVEELSSIPHRATGEPGERQAAQFVRENLEALGLEVSTQTFKAPKILGHPTALFILLALAGVLVGFVAPISGVFIILLVLCCLVRMFNLKGELWTRVVPRGDSINVIGKKIVSNAKRSFVFSAHIDAGQTGLMFHPAVNRLFVRFSGNPKSVQGPMYLPAMVILAGAAVVGVRIFGGQGIVLDVLQWAIAAFLAISLAVTVQWMRSPFVPGAIDNASGVAAMLEAAKALTDDPLDQTNLYFVATGAEETGMRGMKHFYETHQRTLASPKTYYFNFESVGGGSLRAVEEEGELGRFKYPPFLIGFAQFVSKKHGFGELETVNLLAGTDSAVTANAGLPTLCLIALDEMGVPPNYHEMADTADRADFEVTLHAANLVVAVARELENEGL